MLDAYLDAQGGTQITVDWVPVGSKVHWRAEWWDGPTLLDVRTRIYGPTAEFDTFQVKLSRKYSDRAWAVQLVRHVLAGGPLGDERQSLRESVKRLSTTAAPDVPADEHEARLAESLERLAGDLGHIRMLEILATYGLAALGAAGDLPGGLLPFPPRRD